MKKILFTFFIFCTLGSIAQDFTTPIEINNIRAYVTSGGLLFNNAALGRGGFEAPKGPINNPGAKMPIYASALWLGGVDAGSTYRAAAQTYRQGGNDFKCGPIIPILGASLPSDSFRRLWRINKADYLAALNGVETNQTKYWPVYANTGQGRVYMAPFFDANGDGELDVSTYNEYPEFPGDEALFFVYNDDTLHMESQLPRLGVEVKGFVYQFDRPGQQFLNNTVFVDYYITNYSSDAYRDFRATVWTDFDLGNYADDMLGTDSARNMYYCYNGDDNDEGPDGYGGTPPAMGVVFLNQPLYATLPLINSFTTANYYENTMNGLWNDGSPLYDSGTGFHTSGTPTRYAFYGNPCAQTGWTEKGAGNIPGDRSMIGSVAIDNLLPGGVVKLTVAYLFAQSPTGGATGSLCKLFDQADSLNNWYASQQPPLGVPSTQLYDAKLYPNPATGWVTVELPGEIEQLQLGVYDMAGRQVLQTSQPVFSVAGFTPGIYTVRGTAGGSSFSQKLIVQ